MNFRALTKIPQQGVDLYKALMRDLIRDMQNHPDWEKARDWKLVRSMMLIEPVVIPIGAIINTAILPYNIYIKDQNAFIYGAFLLGALLVIVRDYPATEPHNYLDFRETWERMKRG